MDNLEDASSNSISNIVENETLQQSVQFCQTQLVKVEYLDENNGSLLLPVENVEEGNIHIRERRNAEELVHEAGESKGIPSSDFIPSDDVQLISSSSPSSLPTSIVTFPGESTEKRKEITVVSRDKGDTLLDIDVNICSDDSVFVSKRDELDLKLNSSTILPSTILPSDASASSFKATSSPESSIYQIKWISYQDSQCAIVTQNKNGPCPLIAIINVLLLTKRISLQPGIEYQSGENLLSQLASMILESIPENAAEDFLCNYEQNIQDALAILPKLQTGLDINVKFTGIRHEFTQDTLLFDILNVDLVHGWILDKGDEAKDVVERHSSYNGIVEFIISGKTMEDAKVAQDALLAEDWLERTQSQLTYAGLVALSECLTNDAPSVLFRNNHFSTIIKHGNEIYLLVTDQGYADQNDIIWEKLNNIEGDTDFFNDHFCQRNSFTKMDTAQQMELDRQLALSLSQDLNANVGSQSQQHLKEKSDSDIMSQFQFPHQPSHYQIDTAEYDTTFPRLQVNCDNESAVGSRPLSYNAKRPNVQTSQSTYDMRQMIPPCALNVESLPPYERRYESEHDLAAAAQGNQQQSQTVSLPINPNQRRNPRLHQSDPASSASYSGNNKKDKCIIS